MRWSTIGPIGEMFTDRSSLIVVTIPSRMLPSEPISGKRLSIDDLLGQKVTGCWGRGISLSSAACSSLRASDSTGHVVTIPASERKFFSNR